MGIDTAQDRAFESTTPIVVTLAEANSSLTISQFLTEGKNNAPGNLFLLNINPIKLLKSFLSWWVKLYLFSLANLYNRVPQPVTERKLVNVPLTHLYIEKDSPQPYVYLAIIGERYGLRLTNQIGRNFNTHFFTNNKPILNE